MRFAGVDIAAALERHNIVDGGVVAAATTAGELAAAVTMAGGLFPFGLLSVLLASPLHRVFASAGRRLKSFTRKTTRV
jgi:hypothetical protein